jgi:hypothetical protein
MARTVLVAVVVRNNAAEDMRRCVDVANGRKGEILSAWRVFKSKEP